MVCGWKRVPWNGTGPAIAKCSDAFDHVMLNNGRQDQSFILPTYKHTHSLEPFRMWKTPCLLIDAGTLSWMRSWRDCAHFIVNFLFGLPWVVGAGAGAGAALYRFISLKCATSICIDYLNWAATRIKRWLMKIVCKIYDDDAFSFYFFHFHNHDRKFTSTHQQEISIRWKRKKKNRKIKIISFNQLHISCGVFPIVEKLMPN